eukprot:gene9503-biopygen10739
MQRWLEEIAGVYRCCGRRRTRVSAKAPPSPHPPPKPAPAKNGAAVGSFHRRKIDPLRARPPPFQGVPWSMQRAESDLSKTAPPFCWVPRRGCANNGSGIVRQHSVLAAGNTRGGRAGAERCPAHAASFAQVGISVHKAHRVGTPDRPGRAGHPGRAARQGLGPAGRPGPAG